MLIVGFAVALVITTIFGFRFVRRLFIAPPDREPIRAWQNIPYIARAYRVDPQELHAALELTPGVPDRRPLTEIAKDQNRTVDEMIKVLENRIATIAPGPPRRRPRLATATPSP